MKSNVLARKEDLERYLKMSICEASTKDAQEAERKWMLSFYPSVSELQLMMYEVYKFPRPLSVDNFRVSLKRLGLRR